MLSFGSRSDRSFLNALCLHSTDSLCKGFVLKSERMAVRVHLNGTASEQKGYRKVRIGNVSGATGDAPHAMKRMLCEGGCDVITGDWLSEKTVLLWQRSNH